MAMFKGKLSIQNLKELNNLTYDYLEILLIIHHVLKFVTLGFLYISGALETVASKSFYRTNMSLLWILFSRSSYRLNIDDAIKYCNLWSLVGWICRLCMKYHLSIQCNNIILHMIFLMIFGNLSIQKWKIFLKIIWYFFKIAVV